MFFKKELLVFDKSRLKRGHKIKLALIDMETDTVVSRVEGLISKVNDYNITYYNDTESYGHLYVGQVVGHPEAEGRTVQYVIEEVERTKFSDR